MLNQNIKIMDFIFEKDIERYLQLIDVKEAVLATAEDINNEVHKNSLKMQHLVYGGAQIGKMFDAFLPDYLTAYNNGNLHFKHGNDKFETDNVCAENAYFNTETKTSSRSLCPVGSKTHNGNTANPYKYTNDNYEFYIFVKYVIENDKDQQKPININVTHIFLGRLKHSDWKTSPSSSSGSSKIDKHTRDTRFKCIFKKYA